MESETIDLTIVAAADEGAKYALPVLSNPTISAPPSEVFWTNSEISSLLLELALELSSALDVDWGAVAVGCASESFSLSTDTASVPECTSLTNPINGSTDVVIDVNISWDAIPDADGYFITVATSSGGNDILNNQDVGNVTTYDLLTDLPEDTQIFVFFIVTDFIH